MLSQSHIRGLLQSLDFSEGIGTTLNDKSGNGNNATVVGGTWTTDRFGRANRAILLDGVDDYIDLGLADYQGDLSAVVSAKVISLVDPDPIMSKNAFSGSLYPPSFELRMRTSLNSLELRQLTTAPAFINVVGAKTNSFLINNYAIFYFSISNGKGSMGSLGSQAMLLSNVTTQFATGYSIKIGRFQSASYFSNLATDRIMLFNRFLSGHELSKIANRLKIGDMNK